jgi:hypothetical protein
MEKISGIIKPNARTRAVDVSRSQPVRPGAPTWGRPEGKVTKPMIEDKISFSSIAADRPVELATYKNPAESARVKIVNDMADKFFNTAKAPQTLAREYDGPASAETAEYVSESNFSNVNPFSSNEDME